MSEGNRLFEAGPDPFGRMYKVQFRWLQTAISIRHADTVDVKFFVTPEGGDTEEKVVALPHSALLALTSDRGRKLTDSYCLNIAAAHLKRMIETSDDMDKTLVALSDGELADHDKQLESVKARG